MATEPSTEVGIEVTDDALTPDGGAVTNWAEVVRGVYEDVQPNLWRAVVAWSGSTDVADEAVAEGFAQLLRRGSSRSAATVREPAAWVWRASFRLAAGDLQRRRAEANRAVAQGRDEDAVTRLMGPVDRLPDDAMPISLSPGPLHHAHTVSSWLPPPCSWSSA